MKKQFRIRLFDHAKNAAESVALMAAKSNGQDQKFSLRDLKSLGEGIAAQFPDLNPPTTFTLTDDLTLCIDVKIKNDWYQAAIIEEIELTELAEIHELNY